MEICLNEYIRTKNGKIDKVINDNYYISEYIECEKGIVDKENIVKHSFDIIDLIEIGDILTIKEGNDICYIGLKKDTITVTYEELKEQIENGSCELLEILTHEQYERNCYRLEDN